MATITIRKLDDDANEALKELAKKDGRSVEGYVRRLIYKEVEKHPVEKKKNLADEIQSIMSENKVYLNEKEIPSRDENQREVLF